MILRAILLVLVLASCATQTTQGPDVLRHEREAFVAAFEAQDAGRLAALYAHETSFMPFTGQMLSGSEMIAQGLVRVASRMKLELEPAGGSMSGLLAYEAGTWRHLDRTSGALIDSGSYLWTWQRIDGRWVIVAHSVTRKAPAR